MKKKCCEKPNSHFKTGDKVNIVRTRHGWFDGKLSAIITEIFHHETKRVSYTVKDDSGTKHEIYRTSDLRENRNT